MNLRFSPPAPLETLAGISWIGPVMLFLLGLCVSTGSAWWWQSEINRDAEVLFQRHVERVTADIIRRFHHPAYGLYGARGLYAASTHVQRAAFQAYVESRDLAKEFPGVRGFGFIQRVMRPGLDAFVAAERADGAPGFAIRQLADKNHDDLYIIKFIEPAANNVGAQGLDIGSEANRRAAALRAIDTGEPTITAAITLVQDNGKTPGVLLYVPVYAKGAHPSTAEERRASLVGLLYAPIIIAELLNTMTDVGADRIDVNLFDTAPGTPGGTLLYDADRHLANPSATHDAVKGRRFSTTSPLYLSAGDLTLQASSSAGFDAAIDRSSKWLVFAAGAMLSALLALLLRQQATGRRRAELLALEMTDDLRSENEARERSESALREADFRWRFAIEGAGDGLWDWDVTKSTVFFSARWKEMFGFAQDEIGSGLDEWSKRVHPDDLMRVMADVQAHLDGTTPAYAGEHRVSCKDGSWKWILDRGLVVERDATGKPLRVIGTHTDITERKQDEESLLHLTERLTLATRAGGVGIWDYDVANNLLTWDDQMFALYGITRDQFGGAYEAWQAGLHPEDAAQGDAEIEMALRGEKEFDTEFRVLWPNGTVRSIRALAKVMRDAAGQPVRMIGTNWDITERKQAEINLQEHADALALANAELDQHQHHLKELVEARTKELEKARVEADSANRSKSEFLANMSHEIRTPMNGVVGMVDILQATQLNPSQQRMLDTVHNSSLALLSILNDILDFSKIEAGKLEVESIPTHLREVVEGVAQLMLNVAGSKDAQISLFVDPALPTWIYSDPTRLRQVLFNLLGNALKFVSQGKGRAMLHVHPVVRPDGMACVQLSVIDNGIGMSEAVVGRLFKPFSQADASTARKFGGTGLGLSITKRLVEMMHGRISVTSTPSVGSEFTIEFPLQAAPVPAGRATSTQPDLNGVRVMAVTPVAACSTLFQVYLGEAGANVTVVPDLATAHQRLAQLPGDTVLLLDLEDEGVGPIGQAHDPQWPAGVHVVRLVTRDTSREETSDTPAHETRILARPLLRHDLIRGVAVASGRLRTPDSDESVERRFAQRCRAPGVEEAAQSGQLILIAEDNDTNREVMQEQLRLLGYASEVAEDGLVALNMWHSGRYGLLLTDCNMPNMDGFELTGAIRQAEVAGAAGRRLPIIAVTANAMQGEAMRCRERGMDDYLSKPLRLNELGSMLARWRPLSAEVTDVVPDAVPPTPTSLSSIWDATVLTSMVGDNPAMHRRLLEKFLLSANKQVTHIVAAAAIEESATVGNIAHALKSAARTVGTLRFGELCEALETAGKAGDATLCSALIMELPETFALASQRIHKHLESFS